ncbi:hypothetical protein GGI12_000946 [Dipsacomyces acuminosporus]|nr:hypothetical protein GGI12_000946 [Dipsacomyces acuminosporus]
MFEQAPSTRSLSCEGKVEGSESADENDESAAAIRSSVSPVSQKSIPVVVQARRARHPVYKFGALANETFEKGKHQDAFELYSWALLLLCPTKDTTAKEILSKDSVRRQLSRLGWKYDPSSLVPSSSTVSSAAPTPRRLSSAGPTDEAQDPTANKLLPTLPRKSNGSSTDGHDDAKADKGSSGAGKRSWLPFVKGGRWTSTLSGGNSSKNKKGTAGPVIIDEPLPLSKARLPSGNYAFSEAMLRQLRADISSIEQDQAGGEAVKVEIEATTDPSQKRVIAATLPPRSQINSSNSSSSYEIAKTLSALERGGMEAAAAAVASKRRSKSSRVASQHYDPWYMRDGDEKNEVCALLYSNRSAAAFALSKYTAAASDASRSIALRPEWAKGYFRKAEALLALGRVRESYSFYKRAASMEPHDVHVRLSCEKARIMAQNEEMGLRVVQLLPGRDLAFKPKGLHPIRSKIFEFAVGMQNFIYLIADIETRKCVVLDACWDVDGIIAVIEREKLLLAAAAVTHSHFDHTGGIPPAPFSSLCIKVSGIGELKRRYPHLPLLVHPLDIPDVMASNPQLKHHHFTPTPNGFSFTLGERTEIQFVHTPGHTPGSQCLLVNQCRLFSGDTLFPGSCGRVDLKGGSLPDMIESLQTRLCNFPDRTIVYPGHEYGGEWTSIGREKKKGFLRPVGQQGTAEDKWRRLDKQSVVAATLSSSSLGSSSSDSLPSLSPVSSSLPLSPGPAFSPESSNILAHLK